MRGSKLLLAVAGLILSAGLFFAHRHAATPFEMPSLSDARPASSLSPVAPSTLPAVDPGEKHLGRQQRRQQMLEGKKLAGVVEPSPAPRAVKIDDLLKSDSPVDQAAAFEQIKTLADQQPKALSLGLIRWLPDMLRLKRYDDVESACKVAILFRPQDGPSVAAEQRARAVAALNQGKFDEALALARGYYGVVVLNQSSDARSILAAAVKHQAQISSPDTYDPATLAAISNATRNTPIDDSLYAPAIERYAKSTQYNDCIARGNLLLLAGRPADAQAAFESALASLDLTQKGEQKKVQGIADGIARAVCAADASSTRGDALIEALRSSDLAGIQTISAPLANALGAFDYRSQVGRKMALSTEPPPAVTPSLAADQPRISKAAPVDPAPPVPPLEMQRLKEESNGETTANSIVVETGFECSPAMEVHQISPTHFAMRPPTPNWFMFRVHGVAGKTVRFDMVSPGQGLPHWATLNPIYTYATDLNDAATYAVDSNSKGEAEHAWNGPLLSSTAGQQWHFISSAWEENVQRYSFVQRFEKADAIVAMRVPYAPGFNQHELADVASSGSAELVEIGRTAENRPLQMLIFSGGDESRRTQPCILIYAGEHADEHDAMWVARSIARFCAGDSLQAKDLRSHFTILLLPCLDPDSVALGRHSGTILSFHMGARSGDSIQIARWFQNWITARNRLDIVVDLHNIQSAEGPHISPALLEGSGPRGELSTSLNAAILQAEQSAGFTATIGHDRRGWSPARLGGWLAQQYGPLTLAYEVNSQAAGEHLNMAKQGRLGTALILATAQFLEGSEGTALRSDVEMRRSQRLDRFASFAASSSESTEADAIEQESLSWKHATAVQLTQMQLEKWVP